jgi:hypothetical protein
MASTSARRKDLAAQADELERELALEQARLLEAQAIAAGKLPIPKHSKTSKFGAKSSSRGRGKVSSKKPSPKKPSPQQKVTSTTATGSDTPMEKDVEMVSSGTSSEGAPTDADRQRVGEERAETAVANAANFRGSYFDQLRQKS